MIEAGSIKATIGLDAFEFKRGIDQVKAGLSESARMTQDAGRYMDDYNRKLAAGIDPARQAAEAKRQEAALARELNAVQIRLNEALGGGSRIVQDATAKYSLLSNARRADLIAAKEQEAAVNAAAKALDQEAAAADRAAKAQVAADQRAMQSAQDRAREVARLNAAEAQAARARAVSPAGLSAAGAGGSFLITAPIAATEGYALKAAMDVQGAMNVIRSETGATGARLDALGGSFKQIAAQVPNDMDQVAKAVAAVAQRTTLSGQALNDFTKQELTLARVTGTDVGPLITQTTRIFQQYGVATKDQSRALDQFYRAHEVTGIGVKQLMDQVLQFGPTLKSMGLSLTESEALLGSFGKEGDNTGKVVQGLNTAFSRWAKAGITDLHGALANTITAIQKAPSAFAALKIATDAGFSARGGADFVNTIRTGGFAFDDFVKKIEGGSDTIKKAGEDTLTFSGQFAILKHQVDIAAEPLGRFIAGELKDLGQSLSANTPKLVAFGQAFERQSPGMKKAELGVLGIAAAVPPLLFGLGKAALAWEAFSGTIVAGVGLLLNPVTLVIGGIILLTAGLVTAWTRDWDGIQEKTRAVIDTISEAVAAFTGPLKADWDTFTEGLKTAWDTNIGPLAGAAKDTMAGVRVALEAEFPGVVSAWDAFCGRLEKRYGDMLQRLKPKGGVVGILASLAANVVVPGAGVALQQVMGSDAYARNLAREQEKGVSVTAAGIAASGFAAHLGTGGPPVLPSATGGGAYHATGAPPNLKADAATAKDAESAQALLNKETQIATLLKEGYNRADADFIAAHPKIHGAMLAQILALHQQNEAREKLNSANQQAQKIAAELSGKNKDLERRIQDGGRSGTGAAAARVEGADTAHQSLVQSQQAENDRLTARLGTITKARNELASIEHQERERRGSGAGQAADPILDPLNAQITLHKAALAASKAAEEAAAKAVRDHNAALKEGTDKVAELDAAYLKITHGSLKDQLALGSRLHVLYAQLPKDVQAIIDKEVQRTVRNEQENAAQKRTAELMDALGSAGKKAYEEQQKLLGTSRELTDAQILLNQAYAEGDPLLIDWAQGVLDADNANQALARSQAQAKIATQEQAAAFAGLFAQIDGQQQALQDLDLQYQRLTHGSLRDQIALNSQYKTTYDQLSPAIKKWVDAQVTGINKVKEATQKLDFLKQFADGTQQVFEKLFTDLAEHGFKGFFKNVIDSFSQMLQQIAAKYLASHLTDLIFGKADQAGNRGTQGSGGGGLLEKLAGLAIGAFSGGGGGGGGARDIAAAGLSGGALSALAGALPAFAGGGSYSGGPMWVGERGKELIFPHSSGTVIPHAQSMAMAGGGTTNHITINVHGVTDAQSFQAPQNRHAITESLARELQRAQARRR